MSASDLKAILNAPEVLLFLPMVNYVYLFATINLPRGFILSCTAGIVSALVYNILDGVPARNATKVRLGITGLLVFGVFAWLLLLLHSALQLYKAFDQQSIIHEILFFTSLAFIIIVSINLALSKYENEYEAGL